MITLTISGMHCGHCSRAVDEALAEVPGVDKVVEVSLERGEARIEGKPDVDRLITAVEAEGYEARAA